MNTSILVLGTAVDKQCLVFSCRLEFFFTANAIGILFSNCIFGVLKAK
jgi:hypothetical protein